MISCNHKRLGEVMVVIDPFLLECMESDDCYVNLLAFKLSTLYYCNCLPDVFLCTLSPQKLKQVSQ